MVLSARDAEAMKVEALDLGADDYVHKPFGVDELLARLRAGLRHGVQARGSAPVVRTGDLEIDLGLRTVDKAGRPLKLSPKEYDLLAELAVNLGRTVGHKDLLAPSGAASGPTSSTCGSTWASCARSSATSAARRCWSSEPGVGYRLAQPRGLGSGRNEGPRFAARPSASKTDLVRRR